MKHYLAALDIFIDGNCVNTLVAVSAADEKQANALVVGYAKTCVGEGARQEEASDPFFESDDSDVTARIAEVREVTPTVFESVRDMVPVIGKSEVGNLANESTDERAKTLARRLGEQLSGLNAAVPHGKLLKAVAASLGETDWQVLLAKARSEASPLAALEGRQLWVISGRTYGDDDDSVGIIWANCAEEAKESFLRNTLDLSEEDLAEHKDDDPMYVWCSDELLGEVKNGVFEFTSMNQPR